MEDNEAAEKLRRVEEVGRLQKQAAEIKQGLSLEWALGRSGDDHLDLHYTVRHGGAGVVHLLDRVLVFAQGGGFREAPEAMIVLELPETPGTLSLVRGYVAPPRSEVAFELLPGARPLAPGDSLEGRARIPLPPAGWHPNEGVMPLKSDPGRAELRLGLLPAFCELGEWKLADGSVVPVPRAADAYLYQQWLVSEPRPLPASGPETTAQQT